MGQDGNPRAGSITPKPKIKFISAKVENDDVWQAVIDRFPANYVPAKWEKKENWA